MFTCPFADLQEFPETTPEVVPSTSAGVADLENLTSDAETETQTEMHRLTLKQIKTRTEIQKLKKSLHLTNAEILMLLQDEPTEEKSPPAKTTDKPEGKKQDQKPSPKEQPRQTQQEKSPETSEYSCL